MRTDAAIADSEKVDVLLRRTRKRAHRGRDAVDAHYRLGRPVYLTAERERRGAKNTRKNATLKLLPSR